MASNESTCSTNKGTLSESVYVTNDKPELENNDFVEEQRETKTVAENAEDLDVDNDRRIRKLTEKGKEENVRRLKQKRTNALAAVTRKRTDIGKLMHDRNNLDVVKSELAELDRLCQHFHDAHDLYYDELRTKVTF